MHAMRLRAPRIEKAVLVHFAFGVGLALLGVGIVEALLLAGLPPLSPLGWSGLGLLVATAIAGVPGLGAAACVVSLYYALNFAHQDRFPQFYAHPANAVAWMVALSLLAAAIVIARTRVLRAATREAELLANRRYENALRENTEQLRAIADHVPALVSYVDADERYRFNNRRYEDWLGLPRDIVGRSVREVWGEGRYALIKPNVERALRGERVTYEYAVGEGGAVRHILASLVPELGANGRVKGFFALGSDITQLAATRDELRVEHARLEAALDGSSVALWDTDLRSGRVYLSDGWAGMVGAPIGDTITTVGELTALLHPDDVETVKRAALDVFKGLRPAYSVEHRVRASNGEWKWILSRGRVAERDPATQRVLRMIGTNVDITDRRRMEEAVQSVARTDPLTGVANRLAFSERLGMASARARRNRSQLALLYLDIDRFKLVNDSLGHAAGDRVLTDFAMRLRASVRASDSVARFGGDEFVVLIEDVKERGHGIRVAEKIIDDCRAPLRVDERDIVATTSVGLAYSDGTLNEETLLKLADVALYEAKAAGRDCYRVAR